MELNVRAIFKTTSNLQVCPVGPRKKVTQELAVPSKMRTFGPQPRRAGDLRSFQSRSHRGNFLPFVSPHMKPLHGPLSDPSLQTSAVCYTLLLQDFHGNAELLGLSVWFGLVGLVWFCFGIFVSSSSTCYRQVYSKV